MWRRRRDSNPRDAFDAYAISSRAPSTKLGDFSMQVYVYSLLLLSFRRSTKNSITQYVVFCNTFFCEFLIISLFFPRAYRKTENQHSILPMGFVLCYNSSMNLRKEPLP